MALPGACGPPVLDVILGGSSVAQDPYCKGPIVLKLVPVIKVLASTQVHATQTDVPKSNKTLNNLFL